MRQLYTGQLVFGLSILGVGNDPVYSKTLCFDPFPFPDCTDTQRLRIREIAERLDAHRKRQKQLHPL